MTGQLEQSGVAWGQVIKNHFLAYFIHKTDFTRPRAFSSSTETVKAADWPPFVFDLNFSSWKSSLDYAQVTIAIISVPSVIITLFF
jgi:hypothetical protein